MHPLPLLSADGQGPGAKRESVWAGWPSGQPMPASSWQELVFDQFGLHATLQVKTRQALYHGAGKDRLLTVVLARDVLRVLDQMFYCTCSGWDVHPSLPLPARWAIEVTLENGKQLLGLEDVANRLPKAVLRTAPPWSLLLYSSVVAWYHQVGHQWERFLIGRGIGGRRSRPSPTC